MQIILGVLTEGLVYAILSLGVYITYKILDFPSWMSKPTYNSREELQMRMDTLINEQLAALQDKKFVKYY